MNNKSFILPLGKIPFFTTLLALFALSGCLFTQPDGDITIAPARPDSPPPRQAPPEPGQNYMTKSSKSQNFSTLSNKNVAGVWQAQVGDMKCQISTSLTKFGKGYRAAAMLCPVSFAHVKYWQISDNKLLFYSSRDFVIATLAPDPNDSSQLIGESEDHEPMTLWRS